jgi:hypothetical protein
MKKFSYYSAFPNSTETSTLYIFGVDFRNMLIHIRLRIAKVGLKSHFRDS